MTNEVIEAIVETIVELASEKQNFQSCPRTAIYSVFLDVGREISKKLLELQLKERDCRG
jgi:hypothetical protein